MKHALKYALGILMLLAMTFTSQANIAYVIWHSHDPIYSGLYRDGWYLAQPTTMNGNGNPQWFGYAPANNAVIESGTVIRCAKIFRYGQFLGQEVGHCYKYVASTQPSATARVLSAVGHSDYSGNLGMFWEDDGTVLSTTYDTFYKYTETVVEHVVRVIFDFAYDPDVAGQYSPYPANPTVSPPAEVGGVGPIEILVQHTDIFGHTTSYANAIINFTPHAGDRTIDFHVNPADGTWENLGGWPGLAPQSLKDTRGGTPVYPNYQP